MCVITLAASPCYPSRASVLLNEAREQLTRQGIETSHWHLQNFSSEDLNQARLSSPGLQTFYEQLLDARGLIIAVPYRQSVLCQGLRSLLALLPPATLRHKILFPVAIGPDPVPERPLETVLGPLIAPLDPDVILESLYLTEDQITDYQHRGEIGPGARARLTVRLTQVRDYLNGTWTAPRPLRHKKTPGHARG